jgi:hypothetical protein
MKPVRRPVHERRAEAEGGRQNCRNNAANTGGESIE